MKDCCNPAAAKSKTKRVVNGVTTAVILIILGAGLLLTLIHKLGA